MKPKTAPLTMPETTSAVSKKSTVLFRYAAALKSNRFTPPKIRQIYQWRPQRPQGSATTESPPKRGAMSIFHRISRQCDQGVNLFGPFIVPICRDGTCRHAATIKPPRTGPSSRTMPMATCWAPRPRRRNGTPCINLQGQCTPCEKRGQAHHRQRQPPNLRSRHEKIHVGKTGQGRLFYGIGRENHNSLNACQHGKYR